MKLLVLATATVLAAGMIASDSAQAIAYGEPDCESERRHADRTAFGTHGRYPVSVQRLTGPALHGRGGEHPSVPGPRRNRARER